MVQCSKCGETKQKVDFDLRADTGTRRRTCKACRRVSQRLRLQSANPRAPRSQRIVGCREAFTCTRCQRSLPATAFPRKAKGSLFLQSWCRECFSAFNRQNYLENRARDIARVRRNQKVAVDRARQHLRAYLAEHPCVDCGETDAGVLEFDHLRDKSGDVSRMVSSGLSWDRILFEIEKCEVRCANCHRRITRQRRESLRLREAPEEVARAG